MMGMACSREMVPASAMAMVIPVVAPEDWMIMVKTRPSRIPSMGVSTLCISRMKGSKLRSGFSEADIISIPRNRSPKVKMVMAICLDLLVLTKIRVKKPMAIKREANLVMAGNATSWGRKVDPSSAPRVTARLC